MPSASSRPELPPNSARLAALARRILLAALPALLFAGAPGLAQEPAAPLVALFHAARIDDAELAAFALDKGADIEALGPLGLSPLRAATQQNSPNVLKLLLDRGADPAAAGSEDGWTALHIAAVEGHDRLIAPLIAGGGSPPAMTASWICSRNGMHQPQPVPAERHSETSETTRGRSRRM